MTRFRILPILHCLKYSVVTIGHKEPDIECDTCIYRWNLQQMIHICPPHLTITYIRVTFKINDQDFHLTIQKLLSNLNMSKNCQNTYYSLIVLLYFDSRTAIALLQGLFFFHKTVFGQKTNRATLASLFLLPSKYLLLFAGRWSKNM